MSKKQVSARVSMDVYKRITEIEIASKKPRSLVIEDLLKQSLFGSGFVGNPTTPVTATSATEAARQITAEQLRYKQELEECKSRYKNVLNTLNTTKPLQALMSHPLTQKIQGETIVTTPDGKELKISSLHQLLDFVNEYVWQD